MTRIALIHALSHSVGPINDAFERDWPQAVRMNLLDDSLSADLARNGRGRTSPNPMVGAILVRDGAVVGEGYHPYVGGPHAEVVALAEKFGLPVHFIGVGEGAEDLRPFTARSFARSLMGLNPRD